MSAGSACVRFPGETFVSKAEFDAYCRASQAERDLRYGYEASLAAAGALERDGSCASCLGPARFRSVADSAPDWRDGQVCDCAASLGQRARAMLHLLEAEGGLDPWSRVLVVGPEPPLGGRLAAGRPAPHRIGRLQADDGARLRLAAGERAYTLVLAWDYLQRVPPLVEMLAEIRRVLSPGGRFLFTLPFHYRAANTVSRLGHVPRLGGRLPAEFRGEIHDIGWDVLDMLEQAGFAQARAHHYWSDELGYLGAFNFLFVASA